MVGFLTRNDSDILRSKTGPYRHIGYQTNIPPTVFMVLWEGMNITCLVSQSTTTRMVEKPSEAGSCLMKSINIEDHSQEGIGSCFNFP